MAAVTSNERGLERVPHDELALGVVLRLLVKALDRGHLLAFLRDLDAVSHEDEGAGLGQGREAGEDELNPQFGEDGQNQRAGVEEVQQQRIDGRGEE